MSIELADEVTTPSAAVVALQSQIDALDDAIGQAAGTWRQLASDPARAATAATRLGDMERQRDILRVALEEAQGARAAECAEQTREAFDQSAADAAGRLLPLLEQRCELGVQLEEAVGLLATLIQRLYDQGHEIVRACDAAMAQVSGIDTRAAAQHVNTEDLHSLVSQCLARRLGRLWPEEVAPASFGVKIDARVTREADPLQKAFERGVAERRSRIGGTA